MANKKTRILSPSAFEIIQERPKALLLSFAPSQDRGCAPREVWIPRVCLVERINEDRFKEYQVPTWWVAKNKLWRFVQEESWANVKIPGLQEAYEAELRAQALSKKA